VYAIIEDSGTQIKVSTGDVLEIDLRDAAKGDTITFDRVLAIGTGGADATAGKLGMPYLSGASVTATVLGPILGEKIVNRKYSRRKGYRLKKGHRQAYLRVKIGEIVG